MVLFLMSYFKKKKKTLTYLEVFSFFFKILFIYF